MPAPRKPARLWLRPARGSRPATWLIVDNRKQIGTGCAANEFERAQAALEEYLAEIRLVKEMPRAAPADKVSVVDVLQNYCNAKLDASARPEELAFRIATLAKWWSGKTLASVTRQTCEAYVASRSTKSAARRELEDLRSAISMAIAEGACRDKVFVTLPPKPKARTRHLTRNEVAKLLWTAWRYREVQKGIVTDKRPSKHIARFILTALYTSSRSARVWRASFVREEGRPWVDLESGVYFREAPRENAPDNKRAPPIRLPERLLSHMRRWRANGATYVVEYQGRAADPKKGFRKVVERAGLSSDIVRHTFRHTAVTWLMQAGVDKWEVGGFAGMSVETLETVYGHHHPDHQKSVGKAFSGGRAGRVNKASPPINANQSEGENGNKAVQTEPNNPIKSRKAS